jgi:hypothetical protein
MMQPGEPSLDTAFEGLRYLNKLVDMAERHHLVGRCLNVYLHKYIHT